MGRLVFQCPKTHRAFKSDIHTDLDSLNKVRDLRAHIHCPICNEVHELNVKYCHVEDESTVDAKRPEHSAA